ncbi:beta-lactamase family protein [Chloroflexi bacterium TSY]|nr:beta-lactamase family protein [Chloroflexi bacterium TSY]
MNNNQLPRSTPEAQGMSSFAISTFVKAVEQQNIELHSMMLVRHGHVVAEGWWSPYSPERIHLLYSLSKSFTSTAIGLAIDEGLLSVDDLVLSFFPEKAPDNVSAQIAAMRVHHLLSMSTGHREDTLDRVFERGKKDWIAGFLAIPPDQEPGSVFAYNNGATFMLSAILQRLTGMNLVEYLRPRLFEPLGISALFWQENAQGINFGFSGLHITTEAIARFGQLYLQKGQWNGQQLIPAHWIEAVTANHIATTPPPDSPPEDETPDWWQGYGYQFWQCRHNAYRGDGAFGQFCLIMPEQDAVLATTAGVENMQAILDLVWGHLLPAMGRESLPEEKGTQETLSRQLKSLSIQPIQGEPTSHIVESISGQTYDFSYTLGDDDFHHVTLHFYHDHMLLAAEDDDGEHQIEFGYIEWRDGTTTFCAPREVPTLSRGAWTEPNQLTLEMRHIQTPHSLTMEFQFDKETLRVTGRWNVMFNWTELREMQGKQRKVSA